jgi:hypothetical protein
MEHKIYAKRGLSSPSFIQKVMGVKIKENALIEINNLLAEKELQRITVEEIHQIADKYNVNFGTDYEQGTIEFYRAYLLVCLEDKFLSENELQDLRHLKFILELNDKKVDETHQELAGQIYKEEVEKVIQDGELDENERVFIEKLQNDLKLPKEFANRIYQQSGQELIQSLMNNAISDAKLNPQEEKELYAIAKNLNAELKFDDATRTDLEKYKLYWQIENDELPELVVDINIPRSEKCYFMAKNVIWYERSQIAEQRTHSSSRLRLKIAKGLYWRNTLDASQDLLPEKWQIFDQGLLYLTNKRVFFRGEKSDKILLLNRILDFSVFSNGIEVEKDQDKNPFFAFESSTDIFAMLLGKAISQLRN